MSDKSSLERLFCPRSVAVVGAGAKGRAKFGALFTKANIDAGFEGKIYPVHPDGGELFGLKIYPSVGDIPGPVDLACLCVPASRTPAALEDCLEKGVPWAQILSAGFAEEATQEGRKLEEEVRSFPKRGLRIVGPNCFGVHCPICGLTILPGGGFPRKPGTVAFIGQSGGMAVDLGYASPGLGFGWRRMVSFGNACDLGAAELIEHFGDDPDTKIIAAYIEGVKDGRAFFNAVREASRTKPVIVWKGGLTRSGARAVMSHTGSLGGESQVWEAALRQANAVMVSSQDQMLDAVLAFEHLGEFTGRGVTVMGGGGALGVATSDSADRFGLHLKPFSDHTRAAMQEIIPGPGSSFNNPGDVGSPMVPAATLEKLMGLAAADDAIDVILVIQILHHMAVIVSRQMDLPDKTPLAAITQHRAMAETCSRVRDKCGKPVVQILPAISLEEGKIEVESLLREARRVSHEAGIPTYLTLDRALAAIARVSHYYRRRHFLNC